MKEFDLSSQKKGSQSALLGKFRQITDNRTVREQEAAQIVAQKLGRVLDNNFILLRYVDLEGPNVPIPLILVGPTGLQVLYPSPDKGVYRVLEDNWEILNDRTQKYQPATPNLLTRTRLMGQAVATYLRNLGIESGEVEAALIMTDPGAHVDAVRPVTRVVQIDAVDRFVAGLLQKRAGLSKEKIQQIVAALVGDRLQEEQPKETVDAFTLRDETEQHRRSSPAVIFDRVDPSFVNRIPLTNRQWIILGILMFALVILLVVAIIVLLAIL